MTRSVLADSPEYKSFRASVPLKKIPADRNDPRQNWKLFDCGPRNQKCPLMCLPPVSGTADVFFLQCLALSARGIRVIAVELPDYWSVEQFCQGLKDLLTDLHLEKVHLFGASLGGYLAQKFAEFTASCPRVASLILCNSFVDTSIFRLADSSHVFWLMPAALLRSMILSGFESGLMDDAMANAADFMQERIFGVGQSTLASRLTLSCSPGCVQTDKLLDLPVTIINVWDHASLSHQVRTRLQHSYPQAKIGHLKSGGNFPFLSRCEEVNLYIKIHLANFDGK